MLKRQLLGMLVSNPRSSIGGYRSGGAEVLLPKILGHFSDRRQGRMIPLDAAFRCH